MDKINISDRAWNIVEPHMPGRIGTKSRAAQDNRRFTRWRGIATRHAKQSAS